MAIGSSAFQSRSASIGVEVGDIGDPASGSGELVRLVAVSSVSAVMAMLSSRLVSFAGLFAGVVAFLAGILDKETSVSPLARKVTGLIVDSSVAAASSSARSLTSAFAAPAFATESMRS